MTGPEFNKTATAQQKNKEVSFISTDKDKDGYISTLTVYHQLKIEMKSNFTCNGQVVLSSGIVVDSCT
jgi:hypothetical protein